MHFYWELISVGSGMVVFSVSLVMFYRSYRIATVQSLRAWWFVLGTMTVFFLAGYAGFFGILFTRAETNVDVYLLVSQVFLGGSLFVCTCAWIFLKTLRENEEMGKRLNEANLRLRHAQKLEAIGRLAGNVAHDFNNLLTSIMGHAELGMDRVDVETPERRNFTQIREAARRAEKLTSQLLSFSRRQLPRLEPLSLARLVKDSESLLEQAVDPNVDFTIAIKDTGLVNGDADQINLILLNLISNANDAIASSSEGKIELTVRQADSKMIRKHLPDEQGLEDLPDYIELSVRDNGSGIDESIREHIFDPYFTTKGIGEGTGLGLSIAYGIARQHDGYLDVESRQGTGTCFSLYLPQGTEEPAASASENQPASTKKTNMKSVSVLIVDDDPLVLSVAELILKQAGFTVETASDGAQALALVKESGRKYDLILSDVLLPQMTGPEIIAEIKKHHPEQLVVYMSGFTGESHRGLSVDLGDHALIMKPFASEDLLAAIYKAL